MKPLTIEEVITAMQGTCDRAVPAGNIARVVIDSRAVQRGDLFVAIRGERFDGHDFVGTALGVGAMAAVVRQDFDPGARPGAAMPPAGSILIRVQDPLESLGRLGRYYRRSVIGGALTVIGVTGSNGKTTTKCMISHVLGGRWQGRASIKSYNNNIGVPLTLLSADPAESFLICEMGMNAPGEIAALGTLVEPDIAVVTSVAEAHLEKFGTVEKIAEEKLSLLQFVHPDGCAIVNADREVVRKLVLKDRRFAALKRITFGEWPEADLRIANIQTQKRKNVETDGKVETSKSRNVENEGSGDPIGFHFTVNDRFPYVLNVPGRHNVLNALAAIAVGRRFGMDHDEIAERLATFTLPSMRLEAERVGQLTLINDAYNANPASMAAGVGVLSDMPARGRKVLIVGDMRELGAAAAELHKAAAQHIAGVGVDLVIAVGEHAKLISRTIETTSNGATETHAYATTALARRRLISHLKPSDTILVKGSRALGLEALVEAIREWGQGEQGAGRSRSLAHT
jgi:UDP-N-acetylmuramoyl-tripeptide--D-alanyl-D-alanine ligase